MDAVENGAELDAVGHERRLERCNDVADDGLLLAKVKEFMADEFYKKYLASLEESVDADNDGHFENFTDANLDPQYKLFLDNLREDGSLFVVEFSVSNGVSCLTYEADDDGTHDISPFDIVKNRKGRVVRNEKSSHVPSAPKRSRIFTGREDHRLRGRQSDELKTSRAVPVVGAGDAQQNKRDARRGRRISAAKKNAELKTKVCGSFRRKSGSLRQQNPKSFNFESRKNTTVNNEYVEDDSYKAYLMWMEKNNEISKSIPENVLVVKRETGTESSFGSDIIAIGDNPFSDDEYSPFVPARNCNVVDVDGKDAGPLVVYNSWFRKELMNILRKPYNQMEFLHLYHDVSIRNNTTRLRQLRDGREVSYETDIPSESYLDKYPDFRDLFVPWGDDTTDVRDLINLPIKDRHRALNLLRGFFFYLKNVVHDGAFKPWKDTECLRTMPSQC